MKKLLLAIMENIGLIIGLIFFVAIIDLFGLGGSSEFGAGFVFGLLIVFVVFFLKFKGKWDKIIEKLKL